MSERIKDKISEIEESLDYLLSIVPPSYEEYSSDLKTKAACERYFEKIIEGVIDLAFIFIKFKEIRMPEDDEAAFDVLVEKSIINLDLAKKFKEAKDMRNLIIHQYYKIDDLIVYTSITEELENDVKMFIKAIKGNLVR